MIYQRTSEALLNLIRDFNKSGAEKMSAALRASRDLGAYHAHQEMVARKLADPYEDIPWGATPEEALRYLEGKIPMDWRKVEGLSDGYLRSQAFWISGVEQQDTLEDVLQGLETAVKNGETLDTFRSKLDQVFDENGLGAGRAQTIYRTNLQSAYVESQVASYKANPLVQNLTYVTAGDDKVREEHAEWEGITLPKDDDFWDDHTPPCDFNCRCIVRIADDDAELTSQDDSRLDLPPGEGFGTGKDLLNGALAEQAMQVPTMQATGSENLASAADVWGWLPHTVARGKMPPNRAEKGTPAPGFISMPDGRCVALTAPAIDAAPQAMQPWLRGALERPSEVWAAPYRDRKKNLALVLTALLPIEHQTLAVPILSGVVPARGLPPHWILDLSSVRRGVRVI